MDTKEAGHRGGVNAWKGIPPEERKRIMSARNRKRWRKIRREQRGKGE